MSGAHDLDRVVGGNRFLQLQDDNSTPRAPALQDEEARTKNVDSEIQTRLKETTQQLRQEFQELQAQLARNKEWARNVKDEYEGPLKRAKEKLFREIRNLRAQLTSKDEDDEAAIHQVKSECDALRQDLEAAERDLQQRVAYFRDKIMSLELDVQAKLSDIERLTRACAFQKGQLKAKQDAIEFLLRESSYQQQELQDKDLRLAEVNVEMNELQAAFDDEEMALRQEMANDEEMGRRLQKANADKEQLYAALDDASAQAETDVTAMVGLQLLLTEDQTKRKELQTQVHNLMLRIEELTAERERSTSMSFWGKVKKNFGL